MKFSTTLVFLFLGLKTFLAGAWEDHFRLTEESLKKSLSVKQLVVFHSLNDALAKGLPHFKARNAEQLALELGIKKLWNFPCKIQEIPGRKIAVLKIVSFYSDEPDWGLDQNLFEPDQYPHLWTVDSPYMAQRNGLKSQGFRHLYFPGSFNWTSPIESFQIPQQPLGEAPDRAILYHQLALDFFRVGEFYWGCRFLAWSLHYIQDLFQPYHTSQTPSKRFIALKWNGLLPAIDIETTGENIGYYHLGYEKWINGKVKAGMVSLTEALSTEPPKSDFSMTHEKILKFVVNESNSLAPSVGSLCYRIFPKFDAKKGKKAEEVVENPQWEKSVEKNPLMEELLSITVGLFSKMGRLIRLVSQEPLSFLK